MRRGIPLALGMLSLASLGAPDVAAQAGDSVVYVVSSGSHFDVATAKSGLFSFAGHTHTIRAHGVSGRIVYFPSAPDRSHLEIVVPTDSLEVMTPPDTAEIRKVTAAMRADVLDVAHHPEIRFASTAVTKTGSGLHVTGTLSLVGQSRQVSVDMKVAAGTDTLRAAGSFSVKQTDFGIQPYHGGPGGIIRVADQVTFHIEAIGLRAVSP